MDTTRTDIDRPAGPDPFESNLPAIEHAIKTVIRRRRLSGDEAEEFSATVMLRLLENDRAILRKFEGRCTLRTFLVVTIGRMLLDFRIGHWGKWRPSARARRLGPAALLMERLVFRDGLSPSEACEMLRLHHGITESAEELNALLARLPVRLSRRPLDERVLDQVPAEVESPDQNLLRPHIDETVKALGRAVSQLSAEERALVQMHFSERRSIADIARVEGLDQRALYRRFHGLIARLRNELERQGITAADVRGWLGNAEVPAVAALRARPAGARAHRPAQVAA